MKEREVIDRIIEFAENCSTQGLIELYNQIYGNEITYDDIEWESS